MSGLMLVLVAVGIALFVGAPFIALSAHALEEDRERAREAGCDGYLAKPVEPRKVLTEVARFLDQQVPVPAS